MFDAARPSVRLWPMVKPVAAKTRLLKDLHKISNASKKSK